MKATVENCDEFLSGNPSWQSVLRIFNENEDMCCHKVVDEKTGRLFRKVKDKLLLPSSESSLDTDRQDAMGKLLSPLFLAAIPSNGNTEDCTISSTLYLGASLSQAASAAAMRERSAIAQTSSTRVSKDSDTESSSSKAEVAGKEAVGKRPRASPFTSAKDQYEEETGIRFEKFKQPTSNGSTVRSGEDRNSSSSGNSAAAKLPRELAHCDAALVERIEADILHKGQTVTFDDISGLLEAKACVIELICWPMTQPSLFQGLRTLPKGILLFGPPGTGKTLIGKAIAHQSGATFFSISASSLMSKWIGEGEKTVKTLFAVAAYRQPSVIFIDEIDSLLCQRSSEENEATRRMKTEFMVQLDGASTDLNARVVIIGATNRPEELDEAVRRRFVKRIYIPLPDDGSRRDLLNTLIKGVDHSLTDADIEQIVARTDGFSGADMQALCTEAAMGPIREIAQQRRGNLQHVRTTDIPMLTIAHVHAALQVVKPSVSPSDLQRYEDWNNLFGSYKTK